MRSAPEGSPSPSSKVWLLPTLIVLILSACGNEDAAKLPGLATDANPATDANAATDTNLATDTNPTDSGQVSDTLVSANDANAEGDSTEKCGEDQFVDPLSGQCKNATCELMTSALYASIQALIASHNDCAVDTNCVIASTQTTCQGTCGAAVNQTKLSAFKVQLSAIDQALCKATNYASTCGCSTPDCAPPKPGCKKGKCVYYKSTAACSGTQPPNTLCADGAWICKPEMMKLPGADACVEPTCDAVSGSLHDAMKSALAIGRTCKEDNDCTTVSTSIACWGACPAPINTAHKATVEALVKLHDSLCVKANYAEKCGYMTPKCSMPNPGCEAGICVYDKAP